jgi:hypothetical protein
VWETLHDPDAHAPIARALWERAEAVSALPPSALETTHGITDPYARALIRMSEEATGTTVTVIPADMAVLDPEIFARDYGATDLRFFDLSAEKATTKVAEPGAVHGASTHLYSFLVADQVVPSGQLRRAFQDAVVSGNPSVLGADSLRLNLWDRLFDAQPRGGLTTPETLHQSLSRAFPGIR